MTKKKKKSHWESKWVSVLEQYPPEGVLVLTNINEEKPEDSDFGNINQYSDNNWFHLSRKGDIKWWRVFTPEDLWHYQDLAIQIFFQGLVSGEYEEWNLKEAYDINIEELYTWVNSRKSK